MTSNVHRLYAFVLALVLLCAVCTTNAAPVTRQVSVSHQFNDALAPRGPGDFVKKVKKKMSSWRPKSKKKHEEQRLPERLEVGLAQHTVYSDPDIATVYTHPKWKTRPQRPQSPPPFSHNFYKPKNRWSSLVHENNGLGQVEAISPDKVSDPTNGRKGLKIAEGYVFWRNKAAKARQAAEAKRH